MKLKRSLAEVFDPRKIEAEAKEWFNGKVTAAQDWFSTAQHKMQNLPETNYDLGVRFLREGNLRDAVFRFRLALKLKPDWAEAWFELGIAQMRLQETAEAAESFKNVLRLNAAHADARYLLAICDPRALGEGKQPTTMPTHMIQGFFTEIAAQYAVQEAQNNYQAAKVVVEALRPHLTALSALAVTDAGCGIGHTAQLWRKVAGTLTGVDITEAMVGYASASQSPDNQRLFDQLHVGDLRSLRKYIPVHSQDVILCANVLQFVGDLDAAFAEFAACLKAGGVAAITVEPYTGQHYGVVSTTGRFGHATGYVSAIAAKHGLDIALQQNVQLYPKIGCALFVLKARAIAAPAPTPLPQAQA